jgi:cytochrome c peroxidase
VGGRARDHRAADRVARHEHGRTELALIIRVVPRECGRAAGVLLLILASLTAAHAAEYEWVLPRGFPEPSVPADNAMSEAKVQLGRKLFYEERLSATGTHSCATCHQQAKAFTDGRAQAVGIHGDLHARSAMALVNIAYNPRFQWANPELHTLEQQASRPLYNDHPVEMGLRGREAEVLRIFREEEQYAQLFAGAFPADREPVRIDNVLRALASFERTLISGRSAFDRYVFDDDRAALGEDARRGMALFFSDRAGCAQCHSGINFSGAVVHAGARATEPVFVNTGLYNVDGTGRYPEKDTGVETTTHRSRDHGRFRVPTLRNIAVTAPYMHDGSLPTLEAVLDHYSAGGKQAPLGPATRNRHRDAKIRPLALTAEERRALLAFLSSLTDAAFLADARFSDPDALAR